MITNWAGGERGRRNYLPSVCGLTRVGIACSLSLAGTLPAVASLCSTADPTLIPGGMVLESVTAEFINHSLGQTATPPFAVGTPAYRIVNTEPFVTIRTHLYNQNDRFLGAPGKFQCAPCAVPRVKTRSAAGPICNAAPSRRRSKQCDGNRVDSSGHHNL